MESQKTDTTQASFMRELLHNKFMLLTVLLAVGAIVYFIAGLFVLLSR